VWELEESGAAVAVIRIGVSDAIDEVLKAAGAEATAE
jgi:hypothetical protein